jgi:hypothetical protein
MREALTKCWNYVYKYMSLDNQRNGEFVDFMPACERRKKIARLKPVAEPPRQPKPNKRKTTGSGDDDDCNAMCMDLNF